MPKLKRMFSYVREGFLMLFFVPAGACRPGRAYGQLRNV